VTTHFRLGLRVPVSINGRLTKVAKMRYISKNALAIQILELWLDCNDTKRQKAKLNTEKE